MPKQKEEKKPAAKKAAAKKTSSKTSSKAKVTKNKKVTKKSSQKKEENFELRKFSKKEISPVEKELEAKKMEESLLLELEEEHDDELILDAEKDESSTDFQDSSEDKEASEEEVKEEKTKNKKQKEDDNDLDDLVASAIEAEGEKVKRTGRDTEQKIEEDLNVIYQNKDGSLPDMKHFEKKRRSVLVSFLVFFFSVVFFAGVVFSLFYFFEPKKDFSEENVLLSVNGDEKVRIGDEVKYRIRYVNDQEVALVNTELKLYYPEGFIFTDSSVDPKEGEIGVWEIGRLAPHENGFIDVSGEVYGDAYDEKSLRVFLNYSPENFNAPFQQVATYAIEINETPANFDFKAGDTISIGDGFEIDFDFNKENDSDIDFFLQIEGTENFTIKDSSLESEKFNEFLFPLTGFDKSLDVSITGVFSGEDEEANLEFILKGVGEDGEEYIYEKKSHKVALLQSDFAANLIINGAREKIELIPGEALNATLSIKNNGETEISEVVAALTVEAPFHKEKSLLKWAELEDIFDGSVEGKQLGEHNRAGIITWDSSKVTGLNNIMPGESVLIDVTIPLKQAEDIPLEEYQDYMGKAFVELQFEQAGKKDVLSTKPIEIVFNSDLALEIAGEASEDDLEHAVSFKLSNHFHDLENVQLSFDVFGEVELSDETCSVPAGEINIDQEKKSIIWTVPSMPTSVDLLVLECQLNMDEKNPTQTSLTSKIRAEATDTKTGDTLMLLKEGIKLQVEEGAGGMGDPDSAEEEETVSIE